MSLSTAIARLQEIQAMTGLAPVQRAPETSFAGVLGSATSSTGASTPSASASAAGATSFQAVGAAGTQGGGLRWPLAASVPLTSRYGARWGRTHEGIDLGAASGTPVGAAAAGRVVSAGVQSGYGNIVVLRHADGRETAYAHLSGFDVRAGDTVQAGQQIGRVGSTGRSTGPHLHFEVRVGGEQQDPLRHLPQR